MASSSRTTVPAINPNDHGPKLTVVGAVMLSAVALMVSIAAYNHWYSKTFLRSDTPILAIGAMLYVVFFALSVELVDRGFGRHVDSISVEEQQELKRRFMGTLIVFYLAEGVVKISYNLLARRTARSKSYNTVIDLFSGVILLWTLSNIVVVAVSIATLKPPAYSFFIASGVISVAIVVSQLLAFLWIIWRTKASRQSKLSWSLSIGAFVPVCVAAIVCRLAYTPRLPFAGDWTFRDVTNVILFLVDLGMVTITVMAPNLPMFFARTSTGGLFYQPDEMMSTSRKRSIASSTLPSNDASRNASYSRAWAEPLPAKRQSIIRTFSRDNLGTSQRPESVASDVSMLKTCVEIQRSDASEEQQSVAAKDFALVDRHP